jgi:hypothetical protein
MWTNFRLQEGSLVLPPAVTHNRIYGTPRKHLWHPKGYRYHSLRNAGIDDAETSSDEDPLCSDMESGMEGIQPLPDSH